MLLSKDTELRRGTIQYVYMHGLVILRLKLDVPANKRWQRIHLLSDSATVGGDMPCSAGCYWTFFWLAKQSTS